MDRARDLQGWPHADHMRTVRHRPHDWCVLEMGKGPDLLLLHGAGASTHTWRDLIPHLARRHRCIAVDLPGQGFTRAGSLRRCSLDLMTEDIAALCAAEGWSPEAIVGHSAGAVIALNLAARFPKPPATIAINAALGNFRGIASWLYPLLARLLALNPLTSILFTLGGPNLSRARRLIEGTGSNIDETGLACYARLIGDSGHVDATLQMMTQWKIDGLLARLPRIAAPTLLITGENDLAVPPRTSAEAAARMPNAEHVDLPGLGHLAHEEAPAEVARRIETFLEGIGAGVTCGCH